MFESSLDTPEILFIDEANEKLIIHLSQESLNANSIEFQLDEKKWEKANKLIYQVPEGLSGIYKTEQSQKDIFTDFKKKGERIAPSLGRCVEGVYSLRGNDNEMGLFAEIDYPDQININSNNELTLSLWVSPSNIKNKDKLKYTGLLIKDRIGAIGIYHNYEWSHDDVQLRFGQENRTQGLDISFFLKDRKPIEEIHYVLSYIPNHKEGLKLYLNGALSGIQSTLTREKFGTGGMINLHAIQNVFGEVIKNKEFVREARYYNRLLVSEEVERLYRYPGSFAIVSDGLRNGQKYSAKIRLFDGKKIGNPSQPSSGTPVDRSKQIFVEDYRGLFNGDETMMINRAIEDGQKEKKQVLFGGKEYEHGGHLNLRDGDFDLKGVPEQTVIKKTTHWTDFTSNGVTKASGIIFDGNRNSPRANRIRKNRGSFEFEQCGFKGGWQTKKSGLAASLSIEDDPKSVVLKDCIVSDSNSEKPSGVRNDRPVCRGLYIASSSGNIFMEGGKITRIGDLVTDRNGVSIWDETGNHGGGLGWYDLDGMVIQNSGRVDNRREIRLKGVAFSECRKRFAKMNSNPKNIFFEDCLFHVKIGRRCNQPVVFQRHFSEEKNYTGHMTGCTFRYDTGKDFITKGVTASCVVFDNNAQNDSFTAKDNYLEVLDHFTSPDNWEAMFGLTTGGRGAVHGIKIERNKVEVPGGLAFFMIIRPAALQTPLEARSSGIQKLIVKKNTVKSLKRGSLRLGTPMNMNCDECAAFHYYHLKLKDNRYYSLQGGKGLFKDEGFDAAGWCPECGNRKKSGQYIVDLKAG